MIVISRALLHFERLERPPGAVDARIRNAITLLARTRAPFEKPGMHIIWQARHAGVWSWDEARLAALGTPSGAWVSPEPLLDQTGQSDGFCLITRKDGYEGQIWHAGALTASRFWARRPASDDILQFRRSVHGSVPPDPEDDTSSPQARVRELGASLSQIGARFKPLHAGVLALVVLGAPLMYQAGSYIRLNLEHGAALRALAAFSEDSAADFIALESYRSHNAQLVLYRQTLERINPLSPAADLAEAATALGTRITQLRIESGRARARIEAPGDLDPAQLARELEARPTLTNVRLTRTPASTAWDVEADMVDGSGDGQP